MQWGWEGVRFPGKSITKVYGSMLLICITKVVGWCQISRKKVLRYTNPKIITKIVKIWSGFYIYKCRNIWLGLLIFACVATSLDERVKYSYKFVVSTPPRSTDSSPLSQWIVTSTRVWLGWHSDSVSHLTPNHACTDTHTVTASSRQYQSPRDVQVLA